MRINLTLICMVAIAAFFGHLNPARAADSTLTGEMASSNSLLGGPWSCSTKLPAMLGQPAHTEQVTLTFDVAPGNVSHDHVAGATYAGDDYFGYSPKMKMYWSTSADNMGGHGFATSTDGKVYTGTTSMGSSNMSVTNTYAQVSPSNITLHQVLSGNGQQFTIDSACTR